MNPNLKKSLSSRFARGVCHRGLHDLRCPENSRAAFLQAIESNMPFECDVHLSRDGKLVVCHDSDLFRVTKKHGIIEELTFDEIQEFHFFDGSSPMALPDLLALNDGRVPMVIELKAYQGNGRELAKAATPILNGMKNIAECYLISFDPEALRGAKEADIHMPLGFLVGTEAVKHASKELLYEFDFLDVEVHYSLLPRFGRYRKDGGFIVCWTVKNRLTYNIGKKRCDVLTWEEVDSAKEELKVNSFIHKRVNPLVKN